MALPLTAILLNQFTKVVDPIRVTSGFSLQRTAVADLGPDFNPMTPVMKRNKHKQ